MTATPMVRHATLDWKEGLVFGATDPQGHESLIDGNSEVAASPVTLLLQALGACAGADVVSILEKKRVRLRRARIEVSGTRREEYPRRYVEITVTFRLAGEGLTEAHAQRAVELSMEKYCSVSATLDPDLPLRTEIVIEEE